MPGCTAVVHGWGFILDRSGHFNWEVAASSLSPDGSRRVEEGLMLMWQLCVLYF